jgi:protein SCO1/2
MLPLRHSAIAASLVILGCVAGPALSGPQPPAPAPAGNAPAAPRLQAPGFLLPEPLRLQEFTLVDQQGRRFSRASLQKQWTLLMFGYTHCPDVCPATLTQLRATVQKLADADPALKLAVVFVTLDPERDPPAQLKKYLGSVDEGFVGLGGSPADVAAFAGQLRVRYEKGAEAVGSYLIDHTSSVALINPDGDLQALFSAPLRPSSVARDVQAIAGGRVPVGSGAGRDSSTL